MQEYAVVAVCDLEGVAHILGGDAFEVTHRDNDTLLGRELLYGLLDHFIELLPQQ